MHMAGPREAIQHMIIRKNYGGWMVGRTGWVDGGMDGVYRVGGWVWGCDFDPWGWVGRVGLRRYCL